MAPDTLTKAARSALMKKIKGKDTRLEMVVRTAIWKRGARYRNHWGRYHIDIAFPGKKVAVFMDSCFWHLCQEHGRVPQTNVGYWKPKLVRNRMRDLLVNNELEKDGWTVLRFWSHDVLGAGLKEVADRIMEAIE